MRPRWFAAVFFLAPLSSCRSDKASAAESAVLLRTYDVPAGYGPEIKSVINYALDTDDKTPRVARVNLSPNGKLIVVWPAGIQDGVKYLLDQLAKAPSAQPPPTIVCA